MLLGDCLAYLGHVNVEESVENAGKRVCEYVSYDCASNVDPVHAKQPGVQIRASIYAYPRSTFGRMEGGAENSSRVRTRLTLKV